MRGKALTEFEKYFTGRITPAYAGKRSPNTAPMSPLQDHPCVCGEKLSIGCNVATFLGSPLRMRGKGLVANGLIAIVRITPAYAGKSFRMSWSIEG